MANGITGIAHAAFNVSDIEKSLEFYCRGLGFKKAFEISNDKGEPWIVYIKVADGQFIELFYGSGAYDPSLKKSYSHLCFAVDDINTTASAVTSNGIELISPVKRGKDGNFQCWVRDPDGNRIEFMQIMPDSLQANN